MGFRNIRQLYIHVGLGIARLSDGAKPKVDYDFESVLTKPTAEEFARRVFERRSSSVLEAITLKTGESLRWFPRWHPKYARAEKDSQKTVVIYLSLRSGDEPRVNEGESFSERCLRESKAIFPRLLSNRPSRQGPRTAPKA